jgi:hypothetical protein
LNTVVHGALSGQSKSRPSRALVSIILGILLVVALATTYVSFHPAARAGALKPSSGHLQNPIPQHIRDGIETRPAASRSSRKTTIAVAPRVPAPIDKEAEKRWRVVAGPQEATFPELNAAAEDALEQKAIIPAGLVSTSLPPGNAGQELYEADATLIRNLHRHYGFGTN